MIDNLLITTHTFLGVYYIIQLYIRPLFTHS